jgi:DNA-binding MarR family transcriptional regulator
MHDIHFGRYYGSMYRKTMIFMRESFKHLGITFSEAIVLILVCETPGIIQDAVANALSLDKAAVARSLKRLETMGFLRRQGDKANQRVKMAYPTQKALPYKQAADNIMARWNSILMADFQEEEQLRIVVYFQSMRDRALSADIQSEIASLRGILKTVPQI